MTQYRYGVIFNIDRHIRFSDQSGMFDEVDRYDLLKETVSFLTDEVSTLAEARNQVNEVEYFIGQLYDKGIVKEHIFHQDEPYVKICAVLFAICESIVDMFEDVRLFDYLRERGTRPVRVIPISRSNFAIVVKHPLRNENTDFSHKAKTLIRRVR